MVQPLVFTWSILEYLDPYILTYFLLVESVISNTQAPHRSISGSVTQDINRRRVYRIGSYSTVVSLIFICFILFVFRFAFATNVESSLIRTIYGHNFFHKQLSSGSSTQICLTFSVFLVPRSAY